MSALMSGTLPTDPNFFEFSRSRAYVIKYLSNTYNAQMRKSNKQFNRVIFMSFSLNNYDAIKHKQELRNWGCRGCTGGAHVCNRYEFSSAFQRNKNFENRTTFGWVREILGILELRWNNKNSQKGDFWKIFGPICTFYYIKWPLNSRFPSSRSFSRSQKPRGRRD